MNNQLRLSVGAPAYKGKYLLKCINSTLTQTYPVFKIIIVNSCFLDPIDEVVGRFKDNRIKYFKNDLNKAVEYLVDNWNRLFRKTFHLITKHK